MVSSKVVALQMINKFAVDNLFIWDDLEGQLLS